MPNGYIVGRGRSPLNLSETQIRYAMKNSKSNSAAARFLNISLTTYQKYAKSYVDVETEKTLWELQKNKRGKGVKKPYNINKGMYSLVDIFEGKYPEYSVSQLKRRIINSAEKIDFKIECDNCGWSEGRIIDGKLPLVLDHINDDWTDHQRENLRFLCYNCYHNLKGNLVGSQPQWRIEQIEKAKETSKLNQKQKQKEE